MDNEEILPVIPVDKPQARIGKRAGDGEAPVRDANNRGKSTRGGRKEEPKSANERGMSHV